MSVLEKMLCMAASLRAELAADLPDDKRVFAATMLAQLEASFRAGLDEVRGARGAIDAWSNPRDREAVRSYVDEQLLAD